MKIKAQVLIFTLWVLLILSLLVAATSQRVSLALRLSRYQKEGLKALYLARAGINIAIKEIEKDDPVIDSLKDSWADNKDSFEFILPGKSNNDFASVYYTVKKEDKEEVVFGVLDEEGKININNAPAELLSELFDTKGALDSSVIVSNICAWRIEGDTNKAKKFSNIEELMLIEGMSADLYNSVKGLITVYPREGPGKVNINTASKEVLDILIGAASKKLLKNNAHIDNPAGLSEAIIDFRSNKDGVFRDANRIDSELKGLTDGQKNILNDPIEGLKNKVCVQSSFFRIISEGRIHSLSLRRKIDCVFNRKENKIVFWHEGRG